jgi:serine O-acetyltransferase
MEQGFLDELKKKRDEHFVDIQLKEGAQNFINDLMASLFPHFCKEQYFTAGEIGARLSLLERDLRKILASLLGKNGNPDNDPSAVFFDRLPAIYHELLLDAQAINLGDPAAEGTDEVILAYPGFTAIAIYRIAHVFYTLQIPIFPRILTEYAHQLTGIDIHPGASIATSFAIDHGTGIVIGESSVIGKRVKIYQGVTLGALSVDKKLAKKKRHPTIEDDVVIYAQAVILGGDTVIGHHSVIGGNVWLTESVPPYSFVHQETKAIVRPQTDLKNVINFAI